jgi:hypothetical protein
MDMLLSINVHDLRSTQNINRKFSLHKRDCIVFIEKSLNKYSFFCLRIDENNRGNFFFLYLHINDVNTVVQVK